MNAVTVTDRKPRNRCRLQDVQQRDQQLLGAAPVDSPLLERVDDRADSTGPLPGQARRGGGRARFGVACSVCPLRQACTSSVGGRVVTVHPHEAELAAARVRQRDPAWLADYRATRPKVERKLAHLLRRRHGGRRARVRGLVRVAQDFRLLAAAVNLARLASLGLRSTSTGWQVQPA